METTELKKKLIEEIENSSNKNLLEEMYNFLNHHNEAELYKLNHEEKEAIAEARQQVKNGQFISNEGINDEIDEWLNGK